MPDRFGRKTPQEALQESKEAFQKAFLEIIEKGGWQERHPDIDWEAVLEDRQKFPSGTSIYQLSEKYGKNWDEFKAIGNVIEQAERGLRAKPEPKEVTVQAPEWLKNLPPGDMEEYNALVAGIQRNAKELDMELTPGDWQKANDFFGALLEKKGADTQLAEASLGDFLDWLGEEEGADWMERKHISLPLPQLMNDETYQSLLEAKITEEETRTPEAFSNLVNTEFNELPASLQREFVDALGSKVEALRIEHVRETGETLSDEDALAQLTSEDIESARNMAIFTYTGEGEVFPSGLLAANLHEAATLQGMSDAQYMQSAFQSWKASLHSEYTRGRSNEQLWQEFMNPHTSRTGERDSLAGFVEADTERLSGQKRGKMTQPYEMVTSPQGYPGSSAPFSAYGLQPVGQPKVGGGEPVGGYAAQSAVTRDQALSSYMGFIPGNLGAKEQKYLQGFFNTFWNEFGGGTVPDWQKYLKGQNLKSLLPAAKMSKTRFMR